MKGRCLIAALLTAAAVASAQGIVRKDGSFIRPVTPRDSILVADRLLYGFELKGVPDSTVLSFPQVENPFMQDVIALPVWDIDTLRIQKIRASNSRLFDIRAQIAIQPFEEGT